MDTNQSEFGRGFSYCLGLFLAHAERDNGIEKMKEKGFNFGYGLWFDGAKDHIFELEIPEIFNTEKKKDVTRFKDFCIGCSDLLDSDITKIDKEKAVQWAKDLLLDFDRASNIPCQKGRWE